MKTSCRDGPICCAAFRFCAGIFSLLDLSPVLTISRRFCSKLAIDKRFIASPNRSLNALSFCLAVLISFLLFSFQWLLMPKSSWSVDHSTVLAGQTLQPGDVINFQGGLFASAGRGNKYGHSAMYLGRDESNKPIFLDVTKASDKIVVQDEFQTIPRG